MTTTTQKIAIMQAWVDGKTIEWSHASSGPDEWKPLAVHFGNETFSWNWVKFNYRIKPREPREVMVVFSDEKPYAVAPWFEEGCVVPINGHLPPNITHARFREVIE